MKTRTLLLLSVGVGLAILLAGGVFLLQLSTGSDAVEPATIGEAVSVGDVDLTVFGTTQDGAVLSVEVAIGGIDDGLDSFRLVTGDRRLEALTAASEDRCGEITVDPERCNLDFDVSGADGSSRVLVLRRGDEQRNWVLSSP